MTEQTQDEADGTTASGDAPPVSGGTDIDASDLDVQDGAPGDVPASNDAEQMVDDSTLGGTAGDNAGGAG